jgi:hypothetical protein
MGRRIAMLGCDYDIKKANQKRKNLHPASAEADSA